MKAYTRQGKTKNKRSNVQFVPDHVALSAIWSSIFELTIIKGRRGNDSGKKLQQRRKESRSRETIEYLPDSLYTLVIPSTLWVQKFSFLLRHFNLSLH